MSNDSTLYFATYDKGINTVRNGVIEKYNILQNDQFIIHRMLMVNDTIFVYSSNYLNYIINGTIKPYLIKGSLNSYENFYDEVKKNKILERKLYSMVYNPILKELILSTKVGLYRLKNNLKEEIKIDGVKDTAIYSIEIGKDGSYWLGSDEVIYNVKNLKIVSRIRLNKSNQGKVYKLFCDKNGDIWFYVMNKGFYNFTDGEIINVSEKLKIGTTPIQHITEDNEGNVWIATAGKGIFCFHNLNVRSYFEEDGLSNNIITSMCIANSGEKIIGTFNGTSIYNDSIFIKLNYFSDISITNNIFEVKNGQDGNVLVSSTITEKGIKKKAAGINLIFLNRISSCEVEKDIYIGGGLTNRIYYNRFNESNILGDDYKEEILLNNNLVVPIKINEIEKDRNGTVWIGTSHGICKFNSSGKKYFRENKILNSRINQIRIDSTGRVWSAGEYGLAVILPDEKIISVEKLKGNEIYQLTSFDFDNYGNVWLGSINGIYKIPVNEILNDKISSVNYYNEFNGLSSKEISSIVYDKKEDAIWAGTVFGLSKIKINEITLENRNPAPVVFESIELKGGYANIKTENIEIPASEDYIKIRFVSFNYSSPSNIYYKYTLGEGKQWLYTNTNEVEYSSLASGNYNFIVHAIDQNGNESEYSGFKFTVKTPFYKTLWFTSLILLIFVIVVGYISNKRILLARNKADKDIKMQREISELRHQALSASMNPHFIFNSLNSIQDYMNNHGKEEANEYLVNFARLIRMNLELAGKTFIPLRDELIRLELYLKYEMMRFPDRLIYSIEYSKGFAENEYEIPNMILQPFVENAIWHGILNKEGKGLIKIKFCKEELEINRARKNAVKITITDDGIGLEESRKYKKANHISKGTEIIKERLKLLEVEIKDYEFVKIEDRDDGKRGVRVTIMLTEKHYRKRKS